MDNVEAATNTTGSGASTAASTTGGGHGGTAGSAGSAGSHRSDGSSPRQHSLETKDKPIVVKVKCLPISMKKVKEFHSHSRLRQFLIRF